MKKINPFVLIVIILVGGGTQIPLIKEWISKKIPEIQIMSPPPIESIALGALAMTPGVKIKDILKKNFKLKNYDIHLSLSDEKNHSIAFVILNRKKWKIS